MAETTTSPIGTGAGDLSLLLRSWDRSLRALNRSPKPREQYLESAGQLIGFLAERGMPTDAAKVRRHVEAFLADVAERLSPATVSTRYKALRLFFGFLEEELAGRSRRTSEARASRGSRGLRQGARYERSADE